MLSSNDPEMIELAQIELDESEARLVTLNDELRLLLVPKDPDDSKDVIFEIRSGTGGNEASLFAGDLFRIPDILTLRAGPMKWLQKMKGLLVDSIKWLLT
jgi:protein subunit release factor A